MVILIKIIKMPSQDLPDVIQIIKDIQQTELCNSLKVALIVQEYLKNLVTDGNWSNAKDLRELIKKQIKLIKSFIPHESTTLNIFRHMLKVIREEYEAASQKRGDEKSLHQLVTSGPSDVLDYTEYLANLKTSLLDTLAEYKSEIEASSENIAAQSSEHIHSNEIILTVGKSNTVERFLKSAAPNRVFQVIVVESSPVHFSHQMASNLAKSNVQTTVIPFSAVFAMMSRVNKVIIGTHAVLANGGLRAYSGVHTVALAAKHYSVPVMVLAHMYKLSPVHVGYYQQDEFNMCSSPASVLPSSLGALTNTTDVYNPVFDYVPPELVTLFISHYGGNAPSYVYRMLQELYHPDDLEV